MFHETSTNKHYGNILYFKFILFFIFLEVFLHQLKFLLKKNKGKEGKEKYSKW